MRTASELLCVEVSSMRESAEGHCNHHICKHSLRQLLGQAVLHCMAIGENMLVIIV